jgi:hypothetical protein
MTWLKLACFALVVVSLSSCNKKAALPNTPEGTLEKYVNAAFDVHSLSDREHLLALSVGDAHAHVEGMTDESFRHQFMESKLRFVSMKTKDLRKENDGDVSLVYELSYQDGAVNAPTIHTNKKIAYLTRDQAGEWKIKSTKNVKTYIEKKEDLVITPEPAPGEIAPGQK